MQFKLLPTFTVLFILLCSQFIFADDTLRVNIYFDTGKHNIKEAESPKLDSLVKYLTSLKEYQLDLRGHTDSRGSVTYNQKLSERRMETVKKALNQRGIKKKDMTKSAWSELMPAANNDNSHGMMLNRRVEIVVIIPPIPEEVTYEDEIILNDTLSTSESEEAKILKQYGYTRDRTFNESIFTSEIEKTIPLDSNKQTVLDTNKMRMTVDTIVTTYQTIDGFGLSRQPDSTNKKTQLKKTLVVMDWTRSMYHYGTKLYEWHLHNLDKSTIEYLAFFNDGNKLPTELKTMGNTGGIYFNSTVDDISTVTQLMDQVAKNGTGGDFPENYIEALIKSEKQFPDVDTVVLIADNRACIRDWQLIPQLEKKPIKIILCGVPPKRGVINYQFINLAAYTGGSVHVLGTEIKNISMKNDNIYPEPPRDTTIVMKKRKGKIIDIRAEQAKLEKKYKSLSRPPVTIVDGNEYLFPRRSEITINDEKFVIGKASCNQYDFRRKPEVNIIPTFTRGQKIRIVLNKTLRIGVGIIILPVTLPLGLILGGPAGAASAIPIQ